MLDSFRFDFTYHPPEANHLKFRPLEGGIFLHGDHCPVLIRKEDRLNMQYLNWGNEGTHYIYSRKNIIPIHQNAVKHHNLHASDRALIPASAFYFRTPDGRKWKAKPVDSDTCCFAAVRYQRSNISNQPTEHFSILATSAQGTLQDFHCLMPAIIPREYEMDWLSPNSTPECIHQIVESATLPDLLVRQIHTLQETDPKWSSQAA